MQNGDKGQFDIRKINPIKLIIIVFLFFSNPLLAFFLLVAYLTFTENGKGLNERVKRALAEGKLVTVFGDGTNAMASEVRANQAKPGLNDAWQNLGGFFASGLTNMKLKKGKKYLQISLNGSMYNAERVLRDLPASDKIIIEAGTPLIKNYGMAAVRRIRSMRPDAYIVADMKTADLGEREVEMCARAGANAVICLGVAPLEVLEAFIAACEKYGVEAMLDMMNVPSAIMILRKLKKMPRVVILHRGVDETESGKQIPFYQIKQVKGASNCLVAVAGGDTPREVQSAVFNDADIVVLWKDFMTDGTAFGSVIATFLKEIR